MFECQDESTCALKYVAYLLAYESYRQLASYKQGNWQFSPTLDFLYRLHATIHLEVCSTTRIKRPLHNQLQIRKRDMEGLEVSAQMTLIQLIRLELARQPVRELAVG